MEMEFIPLKTPDGSLIGHARVRDGQVLLTLRRATAGRAVILTQSGFFSVVSGAATACAGHVDACALHENGRLIGYGISRGAKLTPAELRRRLAAMTRSSPPEAGQNGGGFTTGASFAREIPHISPQNNVNIKYNDNIDPPVKDSSGAAGIFAPLSGIKSCAFRDGAFPEYGNTVLSAPACGNAASFSPGQRETPATAAPARQGREESGQSQSSQGPNLPPEEGESPPSSASPLPAPGLEPSPPCAEDALEADISALRAAIAKASTFISAKEAGESPSSPQPGSAGEAAFLASEKAGERRFFPEESAFRRSVPAGHGVLSGQASPWPPSSPQPRTARDGAPALSPQPPEQGEARAASDSMREDVVPPCAVEEALPVSAREALQSAAFSDSSDDGESASFFALLRRADSVYRGVSQPGMDPVPPPPPRRSIPGAEPEPLPRIAASDTLGQVRTPVPNPFPHIFPNALFVRVGNGEGVSRLEGDWRRGMERFRILAVPGAYSPQPPSALPGFTRYIRSRAGGFWVRVSYFS